MADSTTMQTHLFKGVGVYLYLNDQQYKTERDDIKKMKVI